MFEQAVPQHQRPSHSSGLFESVRDWLDCLNFCVKAYPKCGLYLSIAAYIEGHEKREASWFCWLGLHSPQSSSTQSVATDSGSSLILESASSRSSVDE